MTDPRPIGIFDSGVGGLSVVVEMRRQLPDESLSYFADTANVPYGAREPGDVRRLSVAAVRRLVHQDRAKLVVVACNTATTLAIKELRARFPVPFVGVEPAVKPAARETASGVVGVLATSATLASEQFAHLVAEHAANVRIVTDAAEGLVEAVERGDLASRRVDALLAQALLPIRQAGADVVVLGCTHYPFLRARIEAMLGPDVHVIESAQPVVRQVGRLLDDHALRAPAGRPGSVQLACSGDPDRFRSVVEVLAPELLGPALAGRGA